MNLMTSLFLKPRSERGNLIFRALILILILSAAFLIRRSGVLSELPQWIGTLGPLAPLLFFAAYIFSVVLFVPGMIFPIAGGFLFNFWFAAGLSIFASALGASTAFLIGRYLVRDFIEKRILSTPRLARVMHLVTKKGWKIALITRLIPLFPFFIGNYAFGTTRMPVRDYFLASLLGTIPSTLFCVYSGHVAEKFSASALHTRTHWEWALIALAVAGFVVFSGMMSRFAAKELRE